MKKDGYTLKGWSPEKGGNTLYDFTAPVKGDLKLYAVWEGKPVAVKDVITDEKTGNTYVVTATGKKNEVSLQEAGVKKGAATVPDTVKIGGKDYQVTSIDKKAFQKASSMKSLSIGMYVTKLFKGTFKKCKKLKIIKIRNKNKVVALNKNMFGKLKGKITLKVPKKMVSKYKTYLKKKKLTKYFKVSKL